MKRIRIIEDELLAFGVGGDDFIRKPYNSAVLLARIARALKTTTNDMLKVRELTLDLPGMRAILCGKPEESRDIVPAWGFTL